MSLIEIHRRRAIFELRMARPPVNALNPALSEAIVEAIATAVADGARGLVLSGNGRVFSAGLDVPYLLSLGDDRAALEHAWGAFLDAARALAAAPVPVVAALTGHAPAGGCVLALCCDYRVMAAGDFLIGLNETQAGLVAPEGIQRLLRRVVGAYQAERLLVAGALIDASQAERIGLVDELVAYDADPEPLLARACHWLNGLLALPTAPMLETRAIARADLIAALHPEYIQIERFIAAWSHPDTQAGLRGLAARMGKSAAA